MRVIRILVMSSVVALAIGACSSNETSEPALPAGGGTDTATEPGVGPRTVTIVDFAFEPADVAPGPGGILTVSNEGATTHTFTMDDGSVDQEVAPGESVEVVVGQQGGFHCRIHPSMTGNVLAT